MGCIYQKTNASFYGRKLILAALVVWSKMKNNALASAGAFFELNSGRLRLGVT
jgi:hypothetical protein